MRIVASVAAAILLGGAPLACLVAPASAGETQAPLVLERSIPLANVSGRIDHMAVDLRRGRLFVAELGNDTVDVVDLTAGRVVHRIGGLREPQGIGYAPAADIVAVANAGDGSVRLYRGEDYTAVARTDLKDDADNVRLDPRSGGFLVGYGGGGIAALDPATGAVVGRVALPAHPEGFRVDADGRRVLVNVPDAGQIAVVDLTTGRQAAAWRVPGLRANFPLAWDEASQVLAVVFRSPARLALLDSGNSAVREVQDTCGDADDVFFDSRRQRIYVSCGSGSVDVFEAADGKHRLLARIPTRSGARTSLFVPELDRLLVAARAGVLGSEAAILVFQPMP